MKLKIEIVDINSIKPDPTNPNVMTEEERDRLRISMRQFGYIQPVIVDENNVIIDGEHRWSIAIDEGYKEIEIIRREGLDEAQKKLLRQAMNKIHGSHNPLKDAEEFRFLIENNMRGDLGLLLGLNDRDLDAYKILIDSPNADISALLTDSNLWLLTFKFNKDLKSSILDALEAKSGKTHEEKILRWLGIKEEGG